MFQHERPKAGSSLTSLVAEADVSSFLSENGILADQVEPYALGAASQNFRVTGRAGLDLTVRYDFRRSLSEIAVDQAYSQLAAAQGILVPEPPCHQGCSGDAAVTVRPTIAGTTVADIPDDALPEPCAIGELLRHIHQSDGSPLPRPPFYAALLAHADALWGEIDAAVEDAADDASLWPVVREARARCQRGRDLLPTLLEAPRGIIHGDFNPPNILVHGSRLAVLDWEKACVWALAADVVQAIYYCSARYGDGGREFAEGFLHGYGAADAFVPCVLRSWLFAFPPLIFLRDLVSAWRNYEGELGEARRKRADAYLRHDSLPRFAHYLEAEAALFAALPG